MEIGRSLYDSLGKLDGNYGSGWKSVEVAGNIFKMCETRTFMDARGSAGGVYIMEVLRILLEIYETRGGRWKYVGVNGNSWKLPPKIVVGAGTASENSTSTDSDNFHLLPCKIPPISWKETYFHPLPHNNKFQVDLLWWKRPWK